MTDTPEYPLDLYFVCVTGINRNDADIRTEATVIVQRKGLSKKDVEDHGYRYFNNMHEANGYEALFATSILVDPRAIKHVITGAIPDSLIFEDDLTPPLDKNIWGEAMEAIPDDD